MRTANTMLVILLAAAGTAAAAPPSNTNDSVNVTVTSGRGQLGFTALEISDQLRAYFGAPKDEGVLVDRLQSDRPGARAGMKVGDVVLSIDGKPSHSVRDLIGAMSDRKKGEEVAIDLIRGGKRMTLHATMDSDAPPKWQSFERVEGFKDFPAFPSFDQGDLQRKLDEVQKKMEQLEQRLDHLERT